jgi:NAD(P)-dependent dehydrogenase (short-subunit alcohol dehydrogenase family)
MNIIITGAGKGIGYETLKIFAKEAEYKVVAISRDLNLPGKLESEPDLKWDTKSVFILPFDLEHEDINASLANRISAFIPSIDILINNAGLLINKPFEDLTDQEFDRLFNVNVKSVFRLVKVLLPLFNVQSHIVNISSMGGFQGSVKFPGLSLYSASKGALSVLTECMAEEFKERQIMVNCLALGGVQTEMLAEAFPNYKAPVTPESMAGFIKDFALSGHRYFNGKILPVSLSTP